MFFIVLDSEIKVFSHQAMELMANITGLMLFFFLIYMCPSVLTLMKPTVMMFNNEYFFVTFCVSSSTFCIQDVMYRNL